MGLWDDIKGGGSWAWDQVQNTPGGQLLGLGDNRFDQANQYGQSNPANFNVPGYEGFQDRYDQYLGQVQDRGAPQIGAYERAQGSAVAGQQQDLADMLRLRASGHGSIAELQLRQGADQSMQQQQAMAAGARPQNAAMAARLAGQNQQRAQAGLGQSTALARAQEAQMAAMGLGGVLGQMRGADESLGMFNAAQQNQRTGQQAQMNQGQMALNDAANANLLGGSLQAAGMQQQGGIANEQNQTNRWGIAMSQPTQGEKNLGAMEGLIKTIGLSDERAKTGKADGGAAADQFLGSLSPHTYAMKPGFRLPGEPQGQTLGVMAQDVRSTPMGKAATGERADGKFYLDPRRMATALAAGMGRLNERLGQLEGRR